MLILASNSERRKKLLTDIGIKFKTVTNDVSEEIDAKQKPEERVIILSKRKADAALEKFPNDTIIAADTMVWLDDAPVNAPNTEEEAFKALKKLSGQSHRVYTGVTIKNKDKESSFFEFATVFMKDYNDIQIYEYIKTEEPYGKAGGYAIQGKGEQLVESYEGDFFTIVGLPLKKLQKELEEFA